MAILGAYYLSQTDFVDVFYHLPSTLFSLNAGLKLNVHKMSRRRPGRLLNVLCTFDLRPLSMGTSLTLKSSSSTVVYQNVRVQENKESRKFCQS